MEMIDVKNVRAGHLLLCSKPFKSIDVGETVKVTYVGFVYFDLESKKYKNRNIKITRDALPEYFRYP